MMSGYKIVLKQIKLPKLDISFCVFYLCLLYDYQWIFRLDFSSLFR